LSSITHLLRYFGYSRAIIYAINKCSLYYYTAEYKKTQTFAGKKSFYPFPARVILILGYNKNGKIITIIIRRDKTKINAIYRRELNFSIKSVRIRL